MLNLKDLLDKEQKLLHELQFRDTLKSAEYHFAIDFDFDGFFEEHLIGVLFEKIKLLSAEIDFVSFKFGCSWPILCDAEKSHLKFSIQSPLIKRIESELAKTFVAGRGDVQFLVDFNKKLVLIKINPVYVRGRYCKFSREVAQTEFFCNKCRGKGCWYCNDTGHFSEDSVEQLIGKVLVPAFDSRLIIFHGAGREDMDVLMLGKGRPFIVELLLPRRRSVDLEAAEKKINSEFKGLISVNSLESCSVHDVAPLKDTFHDKIYSALVVSDKKVDLSKIPLNKELDVVQTTPTRVAKRRADLDRKKKVTIISTTKLSDNEFVLKLKTSHGTYVKEFISGDDKKTSPSISSFTGVNCTCVLLDVMEICD
ncbi:MAG: tRNA pseudouridine(54/55) synthase Pus10 [archaeon]|jgi:tRNA pseudouridine synthase 10